MRNSDSAAVARLLQHARFEVLPTATIEEKILASVPAERQLTVTASPAKGLEETFELTERLAAHGYDVVPHIAARQVHSKTELTEIVARLAAAGVTTVFVPGGDAQAAGDYPDALSLLEDLASIDHPFTDVGITGYPESHPTISDDLTIQSMWDKRKYATQVVSNMTFDPKLIAHWVTRLRARGVQLPLWLGIPGPIDRAKLLTMATKIGGGDSTKFLGKHKGTFARLAAPGGFTGERFLASCGAVAAMPDMKIAGTHVFTFNQVAETEAWRREVLERLAQ